MLILDTSANSSLSDACRCDPAGLNYGFTLLELIVVLVLLSTITALALPNLTNLYATLGRNTERDEILDQLSALGQKAWTSHTNLVLHGAEDPDQTSAVDSDRRSFSDGSPETRLWERDAGYINFEEYEIDVPTGWKLQFESPLRVLANGVCLGAEVALTHDSGYAFRTTLEPPYCHERG